MVGRQIPPPRHDIPCLENILKTGIIPGCVDPSHRDRRQQGSQRSEAFYSSSTYIHTAKPNPHTFVPPYKFNHYKKEVELVIDMKLATQYGCRFWLGAQGAIMTEDVVPAVAVLAVRRLKGHLQAVKHLWPSTGPCWDYSPLAQRPPSRKYEICATPRHQSRHEQMAQELEVDTIAGPPAIAPPSPTEAHQPAP
eukprot:6248003-Pyramimonas_sp.AAC.1